MSRDVNTVELRWLKLEWTVKMCSSYRNFETIILKEANLIASNCFFFEEEDHLLKFENWTLKIISELNQTLYRYRSNC
jgi:hypothetical protein